MTVDGNAGSLTENIIACIEALGADRPDSKGLQELWQALAVALAGFTPGGGVASVVAGTNVTVDDTDPHNPIVSAIGGGGGGVVDSVVPGTGIAVDDTDPANPIVSLVGGGSGDRFAAMGIISLFFANPLQPFPLSDEAVGTGDDFGVTVTMLPQVLGSSGSTGNEIGPCIFAMPDDGGASFTLVYVEFTVTNLDGSEYLVVSTAAPITLSASDSHTFDAAELSVTVDSNGTDLFLNSDGGIQSTAGGTFMSQLLVRSV